MAGKNDESRKLREAKDRQIEERICVYLGLPRTTAPDQPNSGRGAVPIASCVAVSEALKRYLLAGPGGDVPPHAQVIEEMIKSVACRDEEQSAVRRGVVSELDRWSKERWESATLVDFLRAIAARALMGLIWAQSRTYFKRHVPVYEIDDLCSRVIEKLLTVMKGGKTPNGNFGTYASDTRKSVLVDYFRRLRRTRVRFARANDALDRAEAKDSLAKESALECSINELPPIHRAIIRRRLVGQSWSEIAEALGITAKEAQQMAQRAWPGGLSSPRIRRNSRCVSRRTCRATFASTSMSA
jgi:RNA polymerase sigma factor (sigma-70 family)